MCVYFPSFRNFKMEQPRKMLSNGKRNTSLENFKDLEFVEAKVFPMCHLDAFLTFLTWFSVETNHQPTRIHFRIWPPDSRNFNRDY